MKTPSPPTAPASRGGDLMRRLKVVAGLLILMWGIEIVDTIVPVLDLQRHGIRPRTVDGLEGILFAPLLHGGWDHLIANSVPFLILGLLVMVRGIGWYALITGIIILVGGAATWALARGANHIGASGVIFGYMGFLIAAGLFERSLKAIVIAGLVGFLYGGVLLSGVLPSDPGVSWEGHLFGAIGGGVAARFVARSKSGARS